MLSGEKILITGAGGMVAFPIADFLARDNQVWGVSRFGNQAQRDRLNALGITTRSIDLVDGDLSELPDDFTYVLHLAWMRAGAHQNKFPVEVRLPPRSLSTTWVYGAVPRQFTVGG